MTTVRERSIARVRDMVLTVLAGRRARVWLFGSCARGDWAQANEIDVAIEADEPLAPGLLVDLRAALDESTIPFNVAIVDLAEADEALRDEVRKERIPWRT